MSTKTTVVGQPDIPGFELLRLLGRGGFGEVWLARAQTGAHYAIKILPEGPNTDIEFESLSTLERSARAHDHVVHIRQVDRVPGYIYYVMELADDFRGLEAPPDFAHQNYEPHTLALELKRRGRLDLDRARKVVRQLLAALAYIHELGLLHRDIKPGNVIFVGGNAKLADIGLVAKQGGTAPRALTPDYAPPGGVVDASGDLYCLGKMTYEMVTGLPAQDFPWLPDEADEELLRRYRVVSPVIDRACAQEQPRRFQQVSEFAAAMDRCSDSKGGEAEPSDRSPQVWIRQHWRMASAAVLGAAVVTLVIFRVLLGETAGGLEAGKGSADDAPREPTSPNAAAKIAAPPVTIEEFSVNHYRRPAKGSDEFNPTGEIGSTAEPVFEGDAIEVVGRLSTEAYCLLFAMPADGSGPEPCIPEDATAVPPRVEDFMYPSIDKWVLTEGSGLHAFVLITSTEPLPPLVEFAKSLQIEEWRYTPPEKEGDEEPELGAFMFDGLRTTHLGGTRGVQHVRTGVPPGFEALAERLREMASEWSLRAVALPVLPASLPDDQD